MARPKKISTNGKPNKLGAVREILRNNPSATSADIVQALKSQYGITMDSKMASTYRYTILKGQGKKAGKRGRKAGTTTTVAGSDPLSGLDDLLSAGRKLGWQRVKLVVDSIAQA